MNFLERYYDLLRISRLNINMIFQRDLLQATVKNYVLSLQPHSLAYITVRDLQSLKRNASVQCHSYIGW